MSYYKTGGCVVDTLDWAQSNKIRYGYLSGLTNAARIVFLEVDATKVGDAWSGVETWLGDAGL